MNSKRVALTALAAALLAGCSAAPAGGAPKAVAPETSHDFGNVPVVTDMRLARTKQFTIKNEGTGDLRLSNLRVKVLEGC